MSEKAKGIVSLRKKKTTKRPQISAPRQIVPTQQNDSTPSLQPPPLQHSQSSDTAPRNNSQTSQTSLAVPRPRPSLGGPDRTADLVKRRYSTRFANYPQDAERAPSVPNIPAHLAQSRPNRSPDRRSERIRVDINALRDPDLQPDQYVSILLQDASESDIHAYQQDLRKLKNRTSTDLQHNVYQNRTQFIHISNEADKLKSEMHTLRALMSELTGVLSHATSAGSNHEDQNAQQQSRKRQNRSSVANLEALWSTHLQAMWKRVEGSQKFLPAVPGRHIVYESGRWLELNAATWKPRRRLHVILLNDHLLLASEKKRFDPPGMNSSPQSKRASVYQQAQTQTQLVAERCWPLQDIHMTDISTRATDDRHNITTALNVRIGNESWTLASSSASDAGQEVNTLLVHFRKSVEDLRKTLAADQDHRDRAMDELAFLTGQSRFYKKASAQSTDSTTLNSSSTLIDVDGKQQTLRWVENQVDALDLSIALQHFDDAVALSEKLRKLAKNIKGNNVVQDIILSKLDQRGAKLATMLARRLKDTNSGAAATKENVGWLMRLGFEETARSAYLESRKEVLRKRARQIPFTGSLPPHLTALSYVTFAIILHTLRTFSSSFPPTSSSAVVKWAKERIDEFNESLNRQLSSVERGSPLWNECIDVVREQAAVLGEAGVDFSGLIAQGLTQQT
ncbi:putative exocyst complex component Exo84, partial [Aureobasidium melanogenum]